MASNTSGGVTIPESITEWRKKARANGVLGTIDQLGSQVKVRSASKFHFRHFLGLRVIYKFGNKHGRSSLPTQIINQFPMPTTIALDKTSYWNDYLTEIRTFAVTQVGVAASCVPQSLGPMVNVWLYQKHIILGDEDYSDVSKISEVSPVAGRTRGRHIQRAQALATPTRAPKLPGLQKMMQHVSLSEEESGDESLDEELDEEAPDDDLDTADGLRDDKFNTPGFMAEGQLIKDEQTVNVFLLAFLSAITATTVPFHTRWLAERNAMVYEKKVRYVARTDGHLRGATGQTYSLIEVKPRRRKDGDVSIRIQESAQMAAWLTQNRKESHDPYKKCRYRRYPIIPLPGSGLTRTGCSFCRRIKMRSS